MEQKRYHIIIASIIFAVLMWVSVNLSTEETIVTNIPVVIKNLPSNKALRYFVPNTITLRMKGLGWQLAGIYLFKEPEYVIDFSNYSEAYIITNRDPSEYLKLPASVFPLEIDPDTIFIGLDSLVKKSVPVVPKITVSCSNGYGIVGDWQVIPESITISGGLSLVSQINEFATISYRYENQRQPLDLKIQIDEPQMQGLDISPKQVRLIVDIQPFAEKTVAGVVITAISVPSNREIIFIPPKIDLIVRGGIDRLAKLTPDDFPVVFNYQYLVKDTIGILTPQPVTPEGIKVLQKIPEQIRFTIRKRL